MRLKTTSMSLRKQPYLQMLKNGPSYTTSSWRRSKVDKEDVNIEQGEESVIQAVQLIL